KPTPVPTTSDAIFHQCLETFLELKERPLDSLALNATLNYPTGRYYLLKPILVEWILKTQKDERVLSESISIGASPETLDSFFYTHNDCYGDIPTLLPEFIDLVINFCQVIIETQDNQFGGQAFNRRNGFWLANRLHEVGLGLM